MKLLVDSTELQKLLEEKRDEIGHRKAEGTDTFISGLFFFLSSLFATYGSFLFLSGNGMRTLCLMLGAFFTVEGFYMMIRAVRNKYSHKQMYEDIRNLDEVTHPFSIVAIKDTFHEYPNRFLLYYDERWKCKFFFSYRTQESGNEENIKTRLSNELKIPASSITTELRAEQIQRKYSVSDEIDKVYDHKVYYAVISDFRDEIRKDAFMIEGKKFYWMTICEMEQDEEIRKKNLDVVALVKANIG